VHHFSKESFDDYVKRTHSSEIQSVRGRVGGKISSGGGRKKSLSSQESESPWINLGISRRAFFYQKKKAN